MKKTLTILAVLLVAAFAVFAENGATSGDAISQTVTLTAEIATEADFNYSLAFEGSDGTYKTLTETTQGAIDDGFDPSSSNTVNFKLSQNDRVNFNGSAGVTFNIGFTPWTLDAVTSDHTDLQKNEISISALVLVALSNDETHNYNVELSTETNSVTANYTRGVTDATDLFTFEASWEENNNLEAGDYTATVFVSYTAI